MFYTMTVLCRVPEFIFPFEVLFAFLIFLTLILCKRCYSYIFYVTVRPSELNTL